MRVVVGHGLLARRDRLGPADRERVRLRLLQRDGRDARRRVLERLAQQVEARLAACEVGDLLRRAQPVLVDERLVAAPRHEVVRDALARVERAHDERRAPLRALLRVDARAPASMSRLTTARWPNSHAAWSAVQRIVVCASREVRGRRHAADDRGRRVGLHEIRARAAAAIGLTGSRCAACAARAISSTVSSEPGGL